MKSRLRRISIAMLLITANGCSEATGDLAEETKALAKKLESVDFQQAELTQAAVFNAANSAKAVIFVHLDWSAELPTDRMLYVEFMISYARQFPRDRLSFHYIDFTPDSSYKILESLPGWKELEKPNYSLIHGEQEIVWMEGGRVLKVEPIHKFPTVSELIATTRNIYQRQDSGYKAGQENR